MDDHAITDLRAAPGELSFTARIGGREQHVWFRTDAPVTPTADAAIVTALMPAMRHGGTLAVDAPVSPRLLRGQWEHQGLERAWSRTWEWGDPVLEEVDVRAPKRDVDADVPGSGVGALFSGGVDSWSTVLDHPELTHLVFVHGFDLGPEKGDLAGEVEERLRAAAAELGLPLVAVKTNLRELTDAHVRWEQVFAVAAAAVAHLLAPLLARVYVATDCDHETQVMRGPSLRATDLLSSDHLEICEDGGRHSRVERIARIASHPVVQRSLRVCWQNLDGAYNCGRCRKCLMTMLTLEAFGALDSVETLPNRLDLSVMDDFEVSEEVVLLLWQDIHDAAQAAGRDDLTAPVMRLIDRTRAKIGIPPDRTWRVPRDRDDDGPPALDQHVRDVRSSPGELSFLAQIAGREQRVWFRTDAGVTPTADAALVSMLMPAMRHGGTLTVDAPLSPRLLRGQWEFQGLQRAWSRTWEFGDPVLQEAAVRAPERDVGADVRGRGVAAFFSGGVDSWFTVLANPDVTHLVFVRGFDLGREKGELADAVEERLREAAQALELPLITVETNLRELTDDIVGWSSSYCCGVAAVAHLLAPLFERVLVPGDSDHEMQMRRGANLRATNLLSSENTQITEEGGRLSRVERLAQIATNPLVQRSLRVCWRNPGGAYNCGRCNKCLLTMVPLEVLGVRAAVATFPPELNLDAVAGFNLEAQVSLDLWQDVLDAARANGRADVERPLLRLISRTRRRLGLAPTHRARTTPAPPPVETLIAVVVPVHGQPQFLAGAVQSALSQQIDAGIGVVIVDDGCPFPATRRIARELREADPARVTVLHQPNRGLPAARNAGIEHALARWPNVEAIFPLDADDLLSAHTLATLWERLEGHPEAAWATPRLELMGAEQGTWYVPGRYLPYRQLFENQCGSSSLIRRTVLESGATYDETMRHGYEDWELFLHATLKGFTGLQAGECGFRYRRKATSMVSGAQERAEAIRAGIRARHAAAYAPRALVRREHDEWPRFALVRAERPDVLLLAAVDLQPRWIDWPDYAQRVDEAGGGAWPTDEPVPPITVLATEEAVEWLEERHLLAGVLLRLQTELAEHEVVELRIGNRVALGLRTRTLHLRGAQGLEPDAVVELHGLPPGPALSDEKLNGLPTGRRTDLPPLPVVAHADRFARLHIDERETTLPWHGGGRGTSIMLVAPWLRRDGAHRGAVELLRAAQRLDPAIALHLALTEDTDLVDVPLELFETVTFGALVPGADVLVHAGAPVPVAGALHVALDGRAARHLDWLVDVHLAPTEEAAHRLANLDAAPDKIAVAPVAPVWRPEDPEHGRRLAADKNRREGPPAVLHWGRDAFTPDALERADVVVLGSAADPTLALDAMAFGCLVVEDADTAARHTEYARERDAGVERAFAASWEPAARALLDALDAARSRREPVAA